MNAAIIPCSMWYLYAGNCTKAANEEGQQHALGTGLVREGTRLVRGGLGANVTLVSCIQCTIIEEHTIKYISFKIIRKCIFFFWGGANILWFLVLCSGSKKSHIQGLHIKSYTSSFKQSVSFFYMCLFKDVQCAYTFYERLSCCA